VAKVKTATSAFLEKIKQSGGAAVRPSQSRNEYERPQTQGSMTAARVSLKPQVIGNVDKSMHTYDSSSTMTGQTPL
jgi:hypothetical protein